MYCNAYPSTSGTAPALTLAEAENSTDTTEGTISGAVLSAAITAATKPKADLFTPTAGQTVFNLSATPINPASLAFYVNGVDYAGNGATVSGATVTWSGPFALGPEDTVSADYV